MAHASSNDRLAEQRIGGGGVGEWNITPPIGQWVCLSSPSEETLGDQARGREGRKQRYGRRFSELAAIRRAHTDPNITDLVIVNCGIVDLDRQP